jgi:rod shape-determining protein MreC
VSLRDGPLGEIKPPAIWLAAAALAIAVGVALALFAGPPAAKSRLQRAGEGVLGPAGEVLAVPASVASKGVRSIADYFSAGSQNGALRADLAAALTWRDEALSLRVENARLRTLLGLRTEPPLPMVSARTVLDARGPFSNSRLADAGANEGVSEGNPVLSAHGLIGRIAGVGPGVSRILLLTDVESRMPVMILRTNGRAILTGDGGATPELAYLRTHDALKVGDRVLTSGDGGVAPRGLPVGTVTQGVGGGWRVVLDADAEPIDFVRILLYRNFGQVAAPLPPLALPSTATDAPEATPSVSPPTLAAGHKP